MCGGYVGVWCVGGVCMCSGGLCEECMCVSVYVCVGCVCMCVHTEFLHYGSIKTCYIIQY